MKELWHMNFVISFSDHIIWANLIMEINQTKFLLTIVFGNFGAFFALCSLSPLLLLPGPHSSQGMPLPKMPKLPGGTEAFLCSCHWE